MVVYWATKLRGFLRHISERSDEVQFISKGNFYETSSLLNKLKSKLIRSRIFDPVGLFQVIKISGKDCDLYGSFNRFLDADKPYFLYLENPTALYHYALGRIRHTAGKKRFKNCLDDPNLKYIVCMSEACRTTFERINMPLPETVQMKTIYPLVPQNQYVNEMIVQQISKNETLECLYCVQGKRFITKGGLDVLEAVSRLRKAGHRIRLTVITKLADLDKKTLKKIENYEGVSLYDFSFSYGELERIYADTNVLLQPSSDDSFGLTVLEAMKGGCAVIASNLYAFPEMVEDGYNGYLLEPKFRIFTRDNMPNPACWAHKKKRRLTKKKDEAFVRNIEDALLSLYTDREKLYEFSKRSLDIANTKFGEQTICDQWKAVWNTLKGDMFDET